MSEFLSLVLLESCLLISSTRGESFSLAEEMVGAILFDISTTPGEIFDLKEAVKSSAFTLMSSVFSISSDLNSDPGLGADNNATTAPMIPPMI